MSLGNRYRLVADYYRGRAVTRGFPSHVKVELTNACNLDCPFCARQLMTRPVGLMDAGLFRHILGWTSARGCEFAYLHFLGESLLHPDVCDLIGLAHAAGVRVGLSTNATRLDDAMARRLMRSGLDLLVLALDSPTAGPYQQLKAGASHEKTLANIRRVAQLVGGRVHAPEVVVQLTYCDVTVDYLSDLVELRRDLGRDRVHLVVKQVDDWAGQMAHNRSWNPRTFAPARASRAPCVLPWREMVFQWDGTVVPCSRVFDRQLVLGDASVTEPDDIWNGEQMQALRRAHVTGSTDSTPVCSGCPRQSMRPLRFLLRDQYKTRLRHYASSRDVRPKSGLS